MKKNSSIHSGHRNRIKKKLLCDTNDILESHELLEILLFYCIPRKNTNEIAHLLLERFGSVYEFFEATKNDLEEVFYISEKSSSFICALGELKRRIEKERKRRKTKFYSENTRPENVLRFIENLSENGIFIILIDNKGRRVLAKRIKDIDDKFSKDIISKKDTFGIEISGAIVIDYSSASVDIPSMVTLEKVKYIENSLGACSLKLYDYFITDGYEALSVKKKNVFLIKKS